MKLKNILIVVKDIEKLENLYPRVQYINRLMTHNRDIRLSVFYDLDDNLIEVGTPVHGDKC